MVTAYMLDVEVPVADADQQRFRNQPVEPRRSMAEFVRDRDSQAPGHGADGERKHGKVGKWKARGEPHRFDQQDRLEHQLRARNPAHERRGARSTARCRRLRDHRSQRMQCERYPGAPIATQ
jgi:hypothetical protein